MCSEISPIAKSSGGFYREKKAEAPALSEEAVGAVKPEIEEINNRILKLAQADKRPASGVFLMNLDFFAVTGKFWEQGK